MKFCCARKDLVRAVVSAAAVTDAKASMSSLGCVKIEASHGDAISVVGSDTYTTVEALVTSKIERPGSCLVDAKVLRDIANSLPETAADVTLELDATKLLLRAGKARRQIHALYAEDYPDLAKAPEMPVRIAAPSLLRVITTVEHAMMDDNTRPHLNGIKIVCGDGKITAAATDGHRLAVVEDACESGALDVLLPGRGVTASKRVLSDAGDAVVRIGSNDTHAALRCGDTTTIMRRTSEPFPPYERVIPKSPKHTINVNRSMLLSAIRGAKVTAVQEGKERSDAMVMTFDEGEIRLTSQGVRGESSDAVDCDYGGKRITIGFQPQYMMEPLAAMVADDVIIAISTDLDPIRITPATTNETTMVVMPQRCT